MKEKETCENCKSSTNSFTDSVAMRRKIINFLFNLVNSKQNKSQEQDEEEGLNYKDPLVPPDDITYRFPRAWCGDYSLVEVINHTTGWGCGSADPRDIKEAKRWITQKRLNNAITTA